MRRSILPLSALLPLVLACGSPLGPPLEAFHDGRLPESAAAFRRLEPELGELSPHDRARYALYRGLTHLGLGDARAADHWLTLAKRMDSANPGIFSPKDRGELYSAWRSLGRMPGSDD